MPLEGVSAMDAWVSEPDWISKELKFILLQLAAISYGSFVKTTCPLISIFCLFALFSMHLFSNEGIVRWEDFRNTRGRALYDLVISKLGDVIFVSLSISCEVRIVIDIVFIFLTKFWIHCLGCSDKLVHFFIDNYCSPSPVSQFEIFCHAFSLYYMIVVINNLQNMLRD